MKKINLLVICFTFSNFSISQTIDEGKKMFYYERYQSAENIFQSILTKEPNHTEAFFWKAISIYQNSQSKKLNEFVTNNVSGNLKNDAYGKVTMGLNSLVNKDSIAAKKYFLEAIGNDKKKDPKILYAVALSNTIADHGDYLFAISLCEEIQKKDKHNIESYIVEGDAYRKLYDASNAYKVFAAALEINRKDVLANYKIGKIYQAQDNESSLLEYYNKAIEADTAFAPAYYQLYYYYFFHDIAKAKTYLAKYIANTDNSIENDYMRTDLAFVSKDYSEAISDGKNLIDKEGNNIKPRIYKLLAYSYLAKKDSANAENYLTQYFSIEKDTAHYAPLDYELRGKFFEKTKRYYEAATWYAKAFEKENNISKKIDEASTLSNVYKIQKDYIHQSIWLENIYHLKASYATNVDLFNWGLAEYKAKQYIMADSVFAMYQTKYPTQTFGPYWRARSNAAMDTAMETGSAIAHYEDLISIAQKDTLNANNRRWLIEAYSYIGAFKANKDKDYGTALDYYNKVLNLEPANADAIKYKTILEKIVDKERKENILNTKNTNDVVKKDKSGNLK